jgi:hypothetical protein
MSVFGFVGGSLMGYFRFGDSVGWGLALGLGIALILGSVGWRSLHDPTHAQPAPTWSRGSAIRLALPFVALGVATFAGSVAVFIIALAVCLVFGLVLRRLVPR